MKVRLETVSLVVLLGILGGCGKQAGYKVVNPLKAPTGEQPREEAPETTKGKGKAARAKRTGVISQFLKTHVARQQDVRKDDGQVILANAAGDVAIAGVTRSRLDREEATEPSLGGDMFFTRYELGQGWSHHPIQVPVQLAPEQIPVDPEDPDAEPKPLPEPMVVVKGGRLLDSGKALVVGELLDTHFSAGQLHRDETDAAQRNVFMSVFGSGTSGMTKSLRYGLTGENTVVGATASPEPTSVLIAGHTTSGLLPDGTYPVSSQVVGPSNYVAEVDAEGQIKRFFSWRDFNADGRKEDVRGIAANGNTAFVAFDRGRGEGVFVKALRLHAHNPEFIELPTKQVCAEASAGATDVRVASIDATADELVVAVEIIDDTVSDGIVLPCFEVFGIKDLGTIVSKREVVDLYNEPTVQGTIRATFVKDGKILLARSRENTDSRGKGVVVVTFLYERPLTDDGYQGMWWAPSRPEEWYGSNSIDGLRRSVRSIVWPKGSGNEDAVWILSNDVTDKAEGRETLVQIGTYTAVQQTKK